MRPKKTYRKNVCDQTCCCLVWASCWGHLHVVDIDHVLAGASVHLWVYFPSGFPGSVDGCDAVTTKACCCLALDSCEKQLTLMARYIHMRLLLCPFSLKLQTHNSSDCMFDDVQPNEEKWIKIAHDSSSPPHAPPPRLSHAYYILHSSAFFWTNSMHSLLLAEGTSTHPPRLLLLPSLLIYTRLKKYFARLSFLYNPLQSRPPGFFRGFLVS